MGKKSLLAKAWHHWNAMWNKVSWKEIITLFIIGKVFLLFIALNVAHYYVECGDGTVEEIFQNTTVLCGRDVHVERHVNPFGVYWTVTYDDEFPQYNIDLNFTK